jgi:hypothetical protein
MSFKNGWKLIKKICFRNLIVYFIFIGSSFDLANRAVTSEKTSMQ